MELQQRSDDGQVLHVAVIGSLTPDHPEDDPLAEQFGDDVYRRRIMIDLERSAMISSPGIGWLLKWSRKSREAGGKVVFHSVPPLVMQALKIVMVHRVLTLVEDEEAARCYLTDEAA